MTAAEFASLLRRNLGFEPTTQQAALSEALARYLSIETPDDAVFLLNGYAGTGKTSVVSAMVRSLEELNIPVVLLAPTGRAAKVFSTMSGRVASTIHRRIYRMPVPGLPGGEAILNANRLERAVFIVDEASMIGDNADERRGGLLEDLLHYVFTGVSCKLVLLGDTAQLPPVGCDTSPAMNPAVLKQYGLRVSRAVITQVVRQTGASAILRNATWLRRAMTQDPLPTPRFLIDGHDVKAVPGYDLTDEISSAYSRDGIDATILITRSNRSATQANMAIRSQVLCSEEELVRGERIMIAKNNYLWTAKEKRLDFIANGDIATVEAIHATESRHGLRFADVTLHFPDADVDVDCKIILDTLISDSAALDAPRMNALYNGRLTDPSLFHPETSMRDRLKALRTDPWYNALQVKYAYAVTCHKAQGGQWRNVFVDTSAAAAVPDENPHELYRWLYTAFTRATTTLYLINPPE